MKLVENIEKWSVSMLLIHVELLRVQMEREKDTTLRVTLQLMIDETVSELERRNKAFLAERAAKEAAS